VTAQLYWWLQEEEGKQLVRDAIASGIFNDLGSGSNVNLCVIRKGSVDYLRPYDEANAKGKRLVFIHVLHVCHKTA
jgi:20S proteasome subunit beta 2